MTLNLSRWSSTRSVGMNLARPLKAGIEEVFLDCVASATIECSTVAYATKRFYWSDNPGLKRPG